VIHSARDPVKQVLDTVASAIREYNMIEPGHRVICAVSGGPDSMCLLDSLHVLSSEMGFSLYVAHLHHHMRGEQADKDAQLVVDFATSRDIPVEVGHAEVFKLADTLKVGVEEAGRIARYDFFFRLMKQIGAHRIALGHNMNDQAETVIMRLVRGAGTQGLAGIPPVNGPVIRPVIQVPRALIEEYCRQRNLPVITDVYNLDLKYTRNLVRYKIIPGLADMLNPSLIETLAKTAKVLRWDADFLEEQAEAAFLNASMKEGRVTLVSEESLQVLPKAIGSRVLEKAWQECTGETDSLEMSHILRLLEGSEDTLSLPGKVTAHRYQGYISFYPPPPEDVDIKIQVPGQTFVPQLGLCVKTRILKNPGGEDRRSRFTQQKSFFMLELKAWADYNKCEGEIRLRTRRTGDRIAPLGMQGNEKTVKDLLISMRVPRYYRSFVPIFVSGDKLVWVGGFRLSEQFKVGADSCKIIEIEIEPLLRKRQNCATI
jgi:tRNA(Ile)-lysidine synthase